MSLEVGGAAEGTVEISGEGNGEANEEFFPLGGRVSY
jgi:hypothetical protein